MSLGCWNIRDLNDPIKQSEVRRCILNKKLSFIGIVENKIREENLDLV